MIESIKIKNFQKHGTLKLEFGPITCIVGRTDSGKSAILRAVLWACQNKPSGDAFIKHGESETSVRIKLEGRRINRTKNKAGNFYKLDDKEFTAFGNDVPEEISSLLNVTEDNFQKQLSGPYWLELSPGQVSKELNKIVNLDLIDKVLGNIAGELRKSKSVVEVTKERLQAAKTEEERLSWVPQAVFELEAWEKLKADTQVKNFKKCSLVVANNAIRLYKGVINHERKTQALGRQIIDLGTGLIAKTIRLSEIKEISQEIASYKWVLDNEDVRKDGQKTVEKGTKILKLRQTLERLRQINRGITTQKEEIKCKKQVSQIAISKLKEQSKEQQICPYCGANRSLQVVEFMESQLANQT